MKHSLDMISLQRKKYNSTKNRLNNLYEARKGKAMVK